MSVLIKGINIHRGSCWECPCLDGEYGDCNVLEKDVHYIEDKECPIIDLSDHGDLIDRDVVERLAVAIWMRNSNGDDAMQELIHKLREEFPVVISAERSVSPCENCEYRSDVGCSWCKMMERCEDD